MKKHLLFWVVLCFHAAAWAQKEITIADIYQKGTFREEGIQGIRWMKDGRYFSRMDEKNNILKCQVANGEVVETIVRYDDLNPKIEIGDYAFSADERKILFMTDEKAIYRRSFTAEYYIYDLASKKLQKLSSKGAQSYATFSPDGSKVAFCRENNLFWTDLSTMKETQVTKDGQFNVLINGSADWVYEEEFGFAQAFYWSPDGQKIAYMTFDESKVQEYNMQMWSKDQLYPQDYRFKYPKAGEANAIVNVFVYHLKGNKKVRADIGKETDIYIPRVRWTASSDLLSIRRMNRLQNRLDILHADAKTGKTTAVLSEESKTYIDLEYCDDLTYLSDGKHFIHTSERDGYKHLYLYTLSGQLVRQVTKGEWEMIEYLGLDEQQNTLYYISTEISPLERHLYSIRLDGSGKTRLTEESGTHSINMSPDLQYYIRTHSNVSTPSSYSLWKTAGNQQVKLLKENAKVKDKLAEYGFSAKELFSFRNPEGVELHGYMYKPQGFDAAKKYPVLMFVYGGPGSQNVKNAWGGSANDFWHQLLAQKGYVVVCVDNRGTQGRGEAFKKSTYANLGKLEVADQQAAARYLGGLAYVDKTRIGIWGWSYGGYMSSLCAFLCPDEFKAAIAVAPVGTWRLYDTIYTERFLQRPQENAKGYDDYSPVMHANKLKGKYLLVHGTGDDNVHFQNAILIQDALISANKQFESFYYPNRNHGIYGGITRVHLYQMMTDFILRSL